MTDLIEIQNSVAGNTEWSKFASKIGDPFISILDESTRKSLSEIQYQVGKSYNFQDEKFQYRIDVIDDNGQSRFNFFIKPKQAQVIPQTKIKKSLVSPQKDKMSMYLIIVAIAFVVIEFLMLINFGLLKALYG